MAFVPDHKDKIGKRRRVARTARARPENGRELRHHTRSDRVLEKDVRIAGQALDSFLDAGSARVVQRDDGRAVFQRHRLHLDDLVGVRNAERTAEYRKIIGIDEYLTTVDLAVARHDPVAGNFLPVHAVISTTVRDEFIQFDKCPLIQQHFNPLARCHPAGFMPLAQLVLAAAKFRLTVTAFKFLIYPFVILFHGYPIRFAKHPV